MAELKTKPGDGSVQGFLGAISDGKRREDCRTILRIMQKATGAKPRMWGSSIVGFGSYHFKYASGREGDWFLTGFSPSKGDLPLYLMSGFESFAGLLAKLGKHRTGKGCLYIRGLEDLHLPTLEQLVRRSVAQLRKTYR